MEQLNTTTQVQTIGHQFSGTATLSSKKHKFAAPEDIQRQYMEKMRSEKVAVFSKIAIQSIPPRYRGLKFKDMDIRDLDSARAVKIAKQYLDNAPVLLGRGASGFASGGVGTGKTHLSCILTENLGKMGFSAKYTTAWGMVQDIRTAYRDKTVSVAAMVSRYVAYDFLVIDEIGVQNGSNDERVLLFQVINGRYDNIKSTMIISNSKNPVEDGYLDARTIDRLKEGGGFSLTFNGESYRK